MREPHPSDITREQFAQISDDLEGVKKKTRPRNVDLYEIFCAMLYLLKEGVSWRAIPHDFPSRRNVRHCYEVWTSKDISGRSVLDYVPAKLVDIERYETGRNPLPSMPVLDSKTIQNADTAEEKGYDGGKKNRA